MDISSIKELSTLLKQLSEDNLPTGETINFEGLAKYKDHIFKATQSIDNPSLVDKLTPAQSELYNTLKLFPKEHIAELSTSMLTSYYTPDHIAQAMTDQMLGFLRRASDKKISILEPSAGNGKFITAIKDSNVSVTAIEKEPLSAQILTHNLKSLDIDTNVINAPFQKVEPKGFDMVIGNVPFGDFPVFDKYTQNLKSTYQGKIHSFFFVRAIEQTNPGGLIGLITTSSMIDQSSTMNLRRYIVENTDIVNISRFDNSTFKASGTAVTTDMIILQKPKEKKTVLSDTDKLFLSNKTFENKSHNAIFDSDIGHIYGDLNIVQGYLGRPTLVVEPNTSLTPTQEILNTDILKSLELNANFLKLEEQPLTTTNSSGPSLAVEALLANYPHHAMGNIVYDEGAFYITQPDPDNIQNILLKDIRIPPGSEQQTLSILDLRDKYKELTIALRENDTEKAKVIQQEFIGLYDLFNFQYGELNLKPNKDIWLKDSDKDMISSLEVFNGKYYILSDILTKDIVINEEKKEVHLTIEDAITLSLNSTGTIDVDFITKNYNEPEWIREALDKELIFVDPIIENWTTTVNFVLSDKSTFLSGYIEGKLKAYHKDISSDNPFFKYISQAHINKACSLLQEKIPLKLDVQTIDPGLGENWMPLEIYQSFARDLFQDNDTEIKFIPQMDHFKVSSPYSSYKHSNFSVTRPSGRTISHATILQYALQQSVPQLTQTIIVDGKKKTVFDQVSYDSALLKFNKINQSFTQWINHPDQHSLHPRIEELYHRANNAIVKREFIAKELAFPTINPKYIPYSLQNNCAWMMAQNNGGIIDHKVGFGKTMSMALANNLKKRFGKTRKEIIACLNANYVKVYHEFKEIFPQGKYLLVTTDDMAPENRLQTLYKIANNDYDAIICAHSSLMKFPPSPETQKIIYDEIIEETTSTLDDDEQDNFLTRGARNQLLKKLEAAEVKYEQAIHDINSKKDNKLITWEDLKIDSITIDESQYFKNLTFNTRHTNVAGLGSQGETQKTSNLLIYIRACQNIHFQRTGKWDQGATFVSGTILSNAITELYLIFKYLTPDYLASKSIHCFDQWARQYARKESLYEMSLDGNVKLKERFRFFVKVPELASDYARITHYADERTFKIEKPQIKHNLININPTEDQKLYFKALQEFARTKNPEGLIGVNRSDNTRKAAGLIATAQGRKAALDMRLISSTFEDSPTAKINQMARNAKTIYDKYDAKNGTQLIFCDTGTPTSKVYNLYQEIKNSLIYQGIPESQIAFIHDYKGNKKNKLFQDVNYGRIRFLLGSTSKLGVGVNVQRLLVALHHLDFPWRPTDLEQRNGRGDRQGNVILPQYDNIINTFYYATKNSLDAYTLNILQIKQNFIEQFKHANAGIRTFDEGVIDSNGNIPIDMFQSIVSGDQTLMQIARVEKELQSLYGKKNAFKSEARRRQYRLDYLREDLNKFIPIKEKLEESLTLSEKLYSNFASGKITINDILYDNFDNAGLQIENYINERCNKPYNDDKLLLNNGYEIIVVRSDKEQDLSILNYQMLVKTPNNIKIGFSHKQLYKKSKDNVHYIFKCLDKIEPMITDYGKKIFDINNNIQVYEKTNSEKFPDEGKIKELKEELKFLNEKLEKSKNENDNENKNERGNNENDNKNDNEQNNDNSNDNKKPPRGPKM